MGRQPCCTRKGCAMELSIPASPSRLAGLRRAARVYLRGVAEEVADDVVLALDEAATNAVLYGSSGDQPIQVVVQVNDDWVEASVLDRGPAPPAGFPAATDTDELRVGGQGRADARCHGLRQARRFREDRACGMDGVGPPSRLSRRGPRLALDPSSLHLLYHASGGLPIRRRCSPSAANGARSTATAQGWRSDDESPV